MVFTFLDLGIFVVVGNVLISKSENLIKSSKSPFVLSKDLCHEKHEYGR
jgi:hypothetical protein